MDPLKDDNLSREYNQFNLSLELNIHGSFTTHNLTKREWLYYGYNHA